MRFCFYADWDTPLPTPGLILKINPVLVNVKSLDLESQTQRRFFVIYYDAIETLMTRRETFFCNNIRSFLVHSDTEYRPIESPVLHLLPNLDQSVAFRATTLFTISWWPVHNFLLMTIVEFAIFSNTDAKVMEQKEYMPLSVIKLQIIVPKSSAVFLHP